MVSEGIGKATLARRFAAALLGRADRIQQDDLSLPNARNGRPTSATTIRCCTYSLTCPCL
jgi:hypothetical protein